MIESKERLYYLDGIRGIASLMVMFSHIAQLYYPYLIYGGGGAYIHNNVEKIFLKFPFTIFYNGNSGVYIFCVIGGFLSVIVAQKVRDRREFVRLCLKRYIRLMIPIAITTLIVVFILNTIGFLYNSLDSYTYNSSIIAPTGKMGILAYIKYVLWDVFFNKQEFTQVSLSYNHVLWTIQIEFVCSIIIYVIVYLIKKRKIRLAILGSMVICLIYNNELVYAVYFIGALLADLNELIHISFSSKLNWFLILVSLVLLGYPYVLDNNIHSFINNVYKIFFKRVDCGSMSHMLGAIILLLVMINFNILKKFLGKVIFRMLGKMSFWIYLLHWTFLLGIVPVFILLFKDYVSYNISVWCSCFIMMSIISFICWLVIKVERKYCVKVHLQL